MAISDGGDGVNREAAIPVEELVEELAPKRRFGPYPEYRESGAAWPKKLPGRWELRRVKQITRFAYGDALSSENRNDGEIQVFGSNGPVGKHDAANTRGPCLVVGRKGSFGKVNYSDSPCFAIDTTYFVDATQTKADIRWLFYALSWLRLDSFSKDSAVPGLAREDAYCRLLPYCEFDEQRAIAGFLDRETARIDELIAKKQRLIELLAEKRTALISHAVTKGLNPNAPMKPSSIDWLGQVPKHWRSVPLRWHIAVGSGDHISNEDMNREKSDDALHPVIGGNGVMGFTARINTLAPTIVLGRVGALCGNVHLVNYDCWVTDNALRVSRIRRFDQAYLALQLQAMDLNRWADTNAQPLITGGTIKEKYVALPPLDEQRAIVAFLEQEMARIDELLAKIRKAIDMLHDYRSALISAAVTGKIDLRQGGLGTS
jgi:type I restriction enzyme S subunit